MKEYNYKSIKRFDKFGIEFNKLRKFPASKAGVLT